MTNLNKNRHSITGISIVMPAFNVENYIERAIESIINQTYSMWELIIIDDASTDKTQEIIKSYLNKDVRIKGIFLDNNTGGAVIPREKGLKKAKYEWITFIDADDYVDNRYLEILATRQEETESDMIISRQYKKGYKPIPSDEFDFKKIYSGKDCIEYTLYSWKIPGNSNCLFQKEMYYKSLNSGIDRTLQFSDEFLFRIILLNSKTVAFSDAKYFYTTNPSSVTLKPGNLKRFDSLVLWQTFSKIVDCEFSRSSIIYRMTELNRFIDILACIRYLAIHKFKNDHIKKIKLIIKKAIKNVQWEIVKQYARPRQYFLLRYFGTELCYIIFIIRDLTHKKVN